MIDKSHPITKLANLRDLGGVSSENGKLRSGLLYRSDDVANIDQAQLAELLDLGLGMVIDFRSKAEAEAVGRGPLAAEAVDYLHLPVLDFIGEDHNVGQEDLMKEFTNEMLGTWYSEVLHRAAPMISEGIAAVAEHSGPVLFHCAIGKDRTGIFASSIYSLLGVSDSDIVRDFSETDDNLPKILARLTHSQPFWTEETMRATGALMRAQPEAMQTMLRLVQERSGSVAEVLLANGVSESIREKLVAKLH